MIDVRDIIEYEEGLAPSETLDKMSHIAKIGRPVEEVVGERYEFDCDIIPDGLRLPSRRKERGKKGGGHE
jgi:hypothetical protein